MKSGLPISIDLPDGYLEDEVRDGYLVTRQMKEIWAVELDLLKRFDEICKENGIPYMACGGTLLGAIRHNGFIPWDDDLDVMLLRSDYERLCKIANIGLGDPYFFQTEYTDPGMIRGHAQFRNKETTAILKSEADRGYNFCQGIFIDIFPLDQIPNSSDSLMAFREKQKRLKKKTGRFARFTSRYYRESNETIRGAIINAAGLLTSKLYEWNGCRPYNPFYIKLEALYRSYSSGNSERMGIMCLSAENDKFIWKTSYLNTIIKSSFEFLDIPVPAHYEKVLTQTYGGWRSPVYEPSYHGSIIFDAHKAYLNYLGK